MVIENYNKSKEITRMVMEGLIRFNSEDFEILDNNLKDIGERIDDYKQHGKNWLEFAVLFSRWDLVKYFNDNNYYQDYQERLDSCGDPLIRMMAFNLADIELIKQEAKLLQKFMDRKSFIEEIETVQKLLHI